MAIVNLTPHAIVVGGREIPPSGQVARLTTTATPVRDHEGVPLVRTDFGAPEGLPAAKEGTILVVSALVRAALPDRNDLASPGELVRDAAGAVIGCKHLIVN